MTAIGEASGEGKQGRLEECEEKEFEVMGLRGRESVDPGGPDSLTPSGPPIISSLHLSCVSCLETCHH